ncbi:glycosyltransferase family 2 protein [Jeotgalibaca caeni]|uniref:glycosyltransferase family 2 protein n=1 Tax=Jeotgalibaca caeni TaxID=3028623 RepID=UPI00237EBDEC|nr:glycosyltransferase family 2 protein [Jeotgalibaca caeni]MDE1547819.1 glycosyltransferase [Jeotgalibaca caeni]
MKIRKKVVYSLAFLFSIVYLTWRGLYTLPFQESLFAIVFGILLWISEIVSNFTAVILIWSKNKAKEIKKPVVSNEDYPDVDVFIATHNEEEELLLKTVNAAVRMEYPDQSKVHIYLSDDQNRPGVKALAEKFKIGYIGLTGNKHAKSGNLNNALAQTDSPLVATFDADMIPYSGFLMETIPYFIANQKERENNTNVKPLGFIQTPQSFYNADVFQFNLFSEETIPNEQDFFSREVNVLNNVYDAAIYTGSNTVIARRAIEDAGGFPTDTITEDFELGALINSKGYKSISTTEPMASGLTPTDIPSMLKQRIRWGRGVVQSIRNLKIFRNKNLSLQQKLILMNSYLYWWSFVRRLLYILAPILFTVFSIRVVDTDFWTLLLFWLPSYYFLHLAQQDLSTNIRTQQWGEVQETILAPYLFIPVFLQFIGMKETKFKVTNKGATQAKKDLLYVLPHLVLWVLTVIGIVRFNYGKFGSEIFYGSVITFWLFTHLFNLTFSVLFYLGRPVYRKTERFLAHHELTVQAGAKEYHFQTHNISENGLSFLTESPIYFSDSMPLLITITKENYTAHLTGSVVRVIKQGKQWLYGISLEEIPEHDYLEYLQIIYDGFNKSLPQFRDAWMTPFEHFFANISRRFARFKGPSAPLSTFPIIAIEEPVQVNEEEWLLHSFNYQTMVVSTESEQAAPVAIEVEIDQVRFDLEFMEELPGYKWQYRVKNLEQLIASEQLDQLLAKWTQEVGGTYDSNYATT